MKKLYFLLFSVLLLTINSFAGERHWVGGSGSWNDRAHWSETSGGNPGAEIPGPDDNVFIDHNSVLSESKIVLDGEIRIHDFVIQVSPDLLDISGNGNIRLTGSLSVCNGIGSQFSGTWTFAGNGAISSSSEITGDVTIEGNYKAGSDLRFNEKYSFTLISGKFETKDHSITLGKFSSPGMLNRSIDLGSSKIYVNKGWDLSASQNLNFNAGSSRIRASKFVDPVDIRQGSVAYSKFVMPMNNICPPLTLITGFTASNCNNDNTAFAWVTATGCLSGNYTYSWNSNNATSTNDTTFNLPPGTYTITVLCDGDFCDDDVFVTEPAALRFNSITITSPTCFTLCNGSITSNAGGGTPGRTIRYFTYPGMTLLSTGPTLNNACSGQDYLIRVTDSKGCIKDSIISITTPTQIFPNATSTNVLCNGANNGTATAAATGGNSASYTYVWNPGAMGGPSVSSLAPGTYTVTVTDASGCSNTQSVTITQPTPLSVTYTKTNPTCNGQCNGSINVTTSGATPPYTWTWSDSSPLEDRTNLCAGTYTLTVTDANNCEDTIIVPIVEPPPVPVVGTGGGNCIGSNFTLVGSGAGAGGSYTWNPGNLPGPNTIVSPAVTTTYTVTGTNSAGCTNTDTAVVLINPLPNVSISPSSSQICIGACTNLTGSGANTYSWNPGALTGAIINVCPVATTTYTITGTDANGCRNTATAVVTVNPLPTITTNPSTVSICLGTSTSLSASGAGVGGLYEWNPGALAGTPVTVSPVVTTTYTVTGTNTSTGCFNTATSIVTVLPLPNPTATATPAAVCLGSSTVLSATGGVSYSWNPQPTTPAGGTPVTATPTATTTYTVTATAANGCTNTDDVEVIVNPIPAIAVTNPSIAICRGSSGSLTATGGVTYTWNPGGIAGPVITVNPVATTTYTVTGTDNIGCTDTALAIVTVNPLPTVSTNPVNTVICVGQTATLNATGAGATGTYTWTPGSLSGATVNVSPGATTTYTVTGTDANGCRDTSLASVTVTSAFSMTTSASVSVICAGDSTVLTASGAGAGGIYNWNPGGLSGSPLTVSPSVTTTYTVTGTNTGGCTDTAMVPITVNPLPNIVITPTTPNICAGACATITASGAGATGTYVWNPGGTTNPNLNVCPASTSTYTVTGTNSNGCVNVDTAIVRVNPLPVITTSPSTVSICQGSSTSITASGAGTGTYTWNPGNITGTTVTVTPAATTTFTVTGTDANGCSSTATAIVNVNTLPTINATATPAAICVGDTASLSATGGITYSWNPGGLSGTPVLVNPAATTTYTVTGTDANSCTNTATVAVTVNSLPSISVVASPNPICLGSQSTLTANGGTSYTWSPTSSLNTSTGTTVIATPTGPTTYTVTGTNVNGCTSTATVFVNTNALPPVAVTPATSSLCAGDSVTLSATGAGATGTYSWSPSTGLNLTTGSAVVAQPSVTTTYTVTGTDANGCFSSATSIVNVNVIPVITVNPTNTTICPGSCVNITASGAGAGGTYTWTPTTFLSASTGATVSSCPTSTITYTVTGADQFGCSSTATSIVNVITAPVVTVNNTSSNVCAGSSTTLTASGGTTFTWSPASGLNTTTGATVIATPSATTTYTVTGTTGLGCTDTTIAIVNVLTLPNVSISGGGTTVCANSSVTLTGSGASTYAWNPGGLTGTSVTVNPATTTTYTVTGTASNGCTDTATSVINVIPLPIINAGPDVSICIGASTTLNATGAGATGTYNWTPVTSLNFSNIQSPVSTPVSTITYTVTGTNSNNCTGTDEVIVDVNIPNISAGSDGAMCNGDSVTLNASGGVTYIWSPATGLDNPNSSSPVANPGSQTTYTVTATDANGCSGSDIAVVTPDTISVTVSVTSPTVCGGSNGTATATPTSGIGSYTYSWSCSALTTQSVNNLSSGNCIVTVIDSAGCIAITNALISDPVSITDTLAVTDVTTCGGTDGAIAASPSGGNPAYTYSWTGPSGFNSTSQNISGLVEGVYILEVTDQDNCSVLFSDTVEAPVPTPLAVTPSSGTVCPGANITLTATAGFTSYTWSPGTASPNNTQVTTATPASSTVYTVVAVDANNCSNTANATITVASPLVVSAGNDQSVCAGSQVTLAGSGAGPGGTYSWTPDPSLSATNVANPVATVTATTTYTLTATDVNNCSDIDQVIISVSPMNLSITQTPVTICGGSNGTLTVNVTGGTSPYTYSWNTTPSQNTATADSLDVGIYTVLVTDLNGCTGTASDTIVEPATFVLSATVTDASSCVSNNGSIDLTVSGGTIPYTYSWTGCSLSATTEDVTGLDACTYTVNVTDATGCTSVLAVTVTEPTPVQVDAGPDQTICTNSAANLSATAGGTSYSWTPVATLAGANTANPIATPAVTTTYTVVMTDINGCSSTDEVIVSVTSLSLSSTTTPTSSCGTACDATATVSVTGGTAPFTYSWNNSQTTPTATNLCVGVYSVIVTDDVGCSDTLNNVFISSPATFTVSTVVTSPTTCASSNGSIVHTVTGGTRPYTFNWNPAGVSTDSSALNLAPGIYSVLITDANGCGQVETDTVTNPPSVVANAGNDVTICSGTTFDLSAANVGVTYNWSPASGLVSTSGQTVTANPVSTTTFTLTMTDINSCVDTDMVVVTVNPLPTVNAGPNVTICSGSSVTLSAITNGTSVLWDPGSGLSSTSITNPVASPGATSTYTLTAYTAIGCSATDEVIVNVTDLVLSVSSTDPSTCSSGDGTADVDVTGGSGSYTYNWMPGVLITDSISNLSGGAYVVTVTDANLGCTATGTVTLNETNTTTLSSVVTNVSSCSSANGSIDLTVNGTSGPYIFSWSQGANTEDVSGLGAGVYSVSVTDTNGCTVSISDTITAPASIQVNAGADLTACIGDTVFLNATSTATGLSFSWNPSAGLSNSNAPNTFLVASVNQQYVVTVTDAAGCQGTDTVVVTVNNLALGASITSTTTCSATDGIINLNVTGGSTPYTYSWTGPSGFNATTQDLTGLGAGVYSVLVTDGAGCTDTASYPVSEPSNITVVLDSTDSPSACGDPTGAVYVTVSGGLQPYTYSWTGAATASTEDITAIGGGTYNLMVTDPNGCSTAFTSTLVAPIISTVYAGNSAVICLNDSAQLSANGVTSYSWSPATGLNDPTIANPKASPSVTTTYTVTGVAADGCISADTLIVRVNPLPLANAGSDVAVCSGDTATITATGGTSYQWLPSAGLINPNSATTQVPNVTAAMTFSVIVTDNNGCSNSDTIVVNVNALPVADAGSSVTICEGSCTQLNGSSVPPASTYSWLPAFTLNNPNVADPTACPSSTITYTLTVTDANSCTDTAEVVVNVTPAIQISAGPDVSVCPNFGINLVTTGTLSSYTWTPVDGLSCTNCAVPTATPSATTTYTVTGTDALGCSTTDTVVVNVAPIAIAQTQIEPTDCFSNDGLISVTVSGGTSPFSYSWSSGLPDTNVVTITAGTFTLVVIDSLGCTDTSSFDILSLTPVTANAGADTSFCEGGDFTLDGSASVNATVFEWISLPANTVIANTPVTTVSPPIGQSSYVLTVTNGFCSDRDSIVINSAPVPVVDAGPDITIILNTTGQIGGSPTGAAGSSFDWSPGGSLSDSLIANPAASPLETTTYAVTVSNGFGCASVDTMVVMVIPQITFPNGFTPSNGDGLNDVWVIDNIEQFPNALIQVYNRWGELLFSSTGYKEPWDGTYNGKPVPVGTYYYIIDLKDERFPEPYTGPITIIR